MKTIAVLKFIFLISITTAIYSCSKGSGDSGGVEKLYKCSSSGKTLDWDFGGYDTYADDTSSGVMATSYADAKKKCDEKDFQAGEEYQDCVALP